MAESSGPSSLTVIPDRVVFSQSGVSAKIGEEVDETTFVHGNLSIVEKPHGIFIHWTPTESGEDANGDWVFTPPTAVSFSQNTEDVDFSTAAERQEVLKRLQFSVDMRELRSFQCHEERSRKSKSQTQFHPWIRFLGSDGSNFVPLYFREGGVSEFIAMLQRYATLKRSAKEHNLILFTDEKTEALQQSVSLLFKETQSDFLSKLVQNPYATAMTGLGKVSTFVQGQLTQLLMDDDYISREEHRNQVRSLIDDLRRSTDNADAAEDLRCHNDAGFELVTKLELPPRPVVARDPPMTPDLWQTFLEPSGVVKNARELKLLIFRAGISPGLRSEVWKLLLGYYKWEWTNEERQEHRKKRVDDYFRMKLQWKSVSEEQENRFSEFRDRKALVEKDVSRTDRNHRFFEGDHNANVSMLFDILMTYCMWNFDLGYVQGMSDLLSPVLVVMENEVDAFWAFAAFMDKIQHNFEMDQVSIRTQLMHLRDLLMVVNPRLANYLESHNSDNMYFSFRWLLVLFKREFSFANIMRLWEVLWTELPCKNFHLLVCVAVLDHQTQIIIENRFGFTEILKHVNDLSMHIALEETLVTAEAIYHQLAATQDKLPAHICDILGFRPFGSPDASPRPSPDSSGSVQVLE